MTKFPEMTFPEFVTFAQSNDHQNNEDVVVLEGYFNWRSEEPDYVFFGKYPVVCPGQRIHKDLVKRLILGSSFKCGFIDEERMMWSGKIILKEGATAGTSNSEFGKDLLSKLSINAPQLDENSSILLWYTLEKNLKRMDRGWLSGKWNDTPWEACQGKGLEKPLDPTYIVSIQAVGKCKSENIFQLEILKHASNSQLR